MNRVRAAVERNTRTATEPPDIVNNIYNRKREEIASSRLFFFLLYGCHSGIEVSEAAKLFVTPVRRRTAFSAGGVSLYPVLKSSYGTLGLLL